MFKLYTHSWKNNKLFKHFAFPLYIAYILVTCQQIVALPHQFLLGCSTVEPHRGLCASFLDVRRVKLPPRVILYSV